MLNKDCETWYKTYMYASVGRKIPTDLQIDESKAEKLFETEFITPVTLMLYGDSSKELTTDDYKKFMNALRSVDLPSSLHLLNVLIKDKYFEMNTTLGIAYSLAEAALKFKDDHVEAYLCCKDGKDFIGFTKPHKDEIVGSFEDINVCYLGPKSRLVSHGNLIQELAKKSPVSLNDFAVEALRNAVDAGIIEEDKLSTCLYSMPTGNGFEVQTVSAMSAIPSYFVRRLIKLLPAVTVSEAESPYHAALDYAQNHKEYTNCVDELEQIILSAGAKVHVQVNDGLSDTAVLEYINNKFGTEIKDLNELVHPTAQQLYTSSILLPEDDKNISVEEFVDRVNENPESVSGTLDDLIRAYCNQEKVDTNCTVVQLIDHINGIAIVPKTFRDYVIEFKAENHVDGDTTLNEIIAGKTHDPEYDVNITKEIINSIDWMSDELKKEVLYAIDKDDRYIDFPKLNDQLKKIGVPDDIISACLVAEQTSKPFVMPRLSIPTDEAVVNYLKIKGFTAPEAEMLCVGKHLPISMDDIKAYLVSRNVDVKHFDDLLTNKAVIGDTKPKAKLDDPGYKAAESLLYNMRKAITTVDSDELRTAMLPIIYSYMRVLMMSSSDKADATEFLLNKKSECTNETAAFIDEAIEFLK